MYSEMQLFLPFVNEELLEPSDHERCRQLYLQREGKVELVKSLVMPHLKSVTEARLDYEIDCAEDRLNAIGTMLDPENQ